MKKEKPTERGIQQRPVDGIWTQSLIISVLIACLGIISFIFLITLIDEPNEETFAYQHETLTKRDGEVSCSKDYVEELSKFPGCVPKRCGRFVLDSIIEPSHVSTLKSMAERGIALAGSTGGASILDLHSGALSDKDVFINFYKLAEARDMFTPEDYKIYSLVKNRMKTVIADHFGISYDDLYLTHPTFFSRMTNLPAKTLHDEYWHPHIDKETYISFHYTSLLYLNDHGIDFDGGRFIFIDKDTNKTIEPKSGRMSAFTSGSENLHRVEEVSNGVRYALTVAFTCDPKQAIHDPKFL